MRKFSIVVKTRQLMCQLQFFLERTMNIAVILHILILSWQFSPGISVDCDKCIRKCCPLSYAFTTNKTCVSANVPFNLEVDFEYDLVFGHDCGVGKGFAKQFPSGTYHFSPNGNVTVFVTSNLSISKEYNDYCVDNIVGSSNVSALLCVDLQSGVSEVANIGESQFQSPT
ncbi:hypothetical protein JTB14_011040 [Gonioctena quinquepunctata]|nr:hypothetical protein JTB14_011040 [Gonioctena quinquepunctata]